MTANSARYVGAWLVALILLFRAGSAGYGALTARHWSATNATIAESDARWVEVQRSVRKSMWSYKLHIRYVYIVGNKTYVGTRAVFSAWGPDDNLNPFNSSTARAFPVGARVTAYYDPRDPSRSVLQRRPQPSVWIALMLGLLLAKLGNIYKRRVEAEKHVALSTA